MRIRGELTIIRGSFAPIALTHFVLLNLLCLLASSGQLSVINWEQGLSPSSCSVQQINGNENLSREQINTTNPLRNKYTDRKIAPLAVFIKPSNRDICPERSITFSSNVSGSNFVYQWQKDDMNLTDSFRVSGTTASNLTIDPISSEDAGNYKLLLGTSGGWIISNPVRLKIMIPPKIVSHPSIQTACAGTRVQMSLKATGSEPLLYQWLKDGIIIPRATENMYIIQNASLLDVGNYGVIVSNICSQIESDAANLAINVSPIITFHPQSRTVCLGQTISFSVEATGSEPLSYQWKKNGSPISEPTANSSTLMLDSIQTSDAGNYTVEVTNACGTVTSSKAILTVNSFPRIIDSSSNLFVCLGRTASFSVKAIGTEPLFYQWKKNGLAIDGANSNIFVISEVEPMNSGNYSVIVYNVCGQIESKTFQLTVNLPPTITYSPLNQTICESKKAVFSISASGTGPFSYQWKKDGQWLTNTFNNHISGTNTAELIISQATQEDAGDYRVDVTGICDSVESNPANLTVAMPPKIITFEPHGQFIHEGIAISFDVRANGTEPLYYKWLKNGAIIPECTSNVYAIPNVSPKDDSKYSVIVSNMCGSDESCGSLNIERYPYQDHR